MEWLQEILKNIDGKEEIVKQIMAEISQGFVAKSDFDTIQTEKEKMTEQFKTMEEDIKKAAEYHTEFQKKYEYKEETLKKEIDTLKQANKKIQKEGAIDKAILKANGRNLKAIKAQFDLDKIILNENGTLEGMDLESLKKTDEYLFDIKTVTYEGTGFTDGAKIDKKGVKDMNYSELAAFMQANPELTIK